MDDTDANKYALLAAGIYGTFAGRHEDVNERVMDMMEFVRELDPVRFDRSQEKFSGIYARFIAAG